MTNDDHLDQSKQFSHFTLGPFKGMILPMITLITITTRRDVGLLLVTSLNMLMRDRDTHIQRPKKNSPFLSPLPFRH
jgi:hypothetical protein